MFWMELKTKKKIRFGMGSISHKQQNGYKLMNKSREF